MQPNTCDGMHCQRKALPSLARHAGTLTDVRRPAEAGHGLDVSIAVVRGVNAAGAALLSHFATVGGQLLQLRAHAVGLPLQELRQRLIQRAGAAYIPATMSSAAAVESSAKVLRCGLCGRDSCL